MSDSSEYVTGGYFLTQLFRRPQQMNADLVPETVVTISTCLTEVIPCAWYPNEEPDKRNLESAAKMGVPADRLNDVYPWMREHPSQPPIWPYAFAEADRAREFAREFLAAAEDVFLIGASLPAESVGIFLEEAGDKWVSEFTEVVRLKQPRARGGTLLGYEILGDAINEYHTLLCTSGENDVCGQMGIRLNQHGLFDSLADASRAAQWSSEEGNAEPVVYLPWRIERYAW
ncbi:MAG: hypothetical protein AMK72_13025 [Planctomycetes bacterium SM23_25]|nr:MAG: hypothetical protein AMK72_13025 [Planctomycetes bacterium SM23_25]